MAITKFLSEGVQELNEKWGSRLSPQKADYFSMRYQDLLMEIGEEAFKGTDANVEIGGDNESEMFFEDLAHLLLGDAF